MRKFSKFEKSFITLGILLTLGGAYLFVYQAENIGIYLGFLVESQRAPLGRLEFSKNSVRRRPFSARNFLNLNFQQKVFDHDTIMTEDGAEAIFSLNDGGVLNLGPNTLVELVAKDSNPLQGGMPHIVLNVKQGEVTGSEGAGNDITIIREGKPVELPKPKAASLLTQVTKTEKAELKSDCKVNMDLRGIGEVELSPMCNGQETPNSKVTIFDQSKNVVAQSQTLPAVIKFPAPGIYTVKWENTFADDQDINVPSEWPGIEFISQTLSCDGAIDWKLTGTTPTKDTTYVVEATNQSQASPQFHDSWGVVGELISGFPVQIRVKTTPNAQGFSWASNPLKIANAPNCNVIAEPKNHAEVDLPRGNRRVVFTWVQKTGNDKVRFELSQTPDFKKKTTFSQITQKNYARPPIKKAGTYYWRVADPTTGELSMTYELIVK